jgi:Ni/Co efflux regulator RcnB
VSYYDVPRSVVLTLGVPPSGYRYIRVASDILLIGVDTNIVVDAIEDLVR